MEFVSAKVAGRGEVRLEEWPCAAALQSLAFVFGDDGEVVEEVGGAFVGGRGGGGGDGGDFVVVGSEADPVLFCDLLGEDYLGVVG